MARRPQEPDLSPAERAQQAFARGGSFLWKGKVYTNAEELAEAEDAPEVKAAAPAPVREAARPEGPARRP